MSLLREFVAPKSLVGLQVTDSHIGAVQIYNSLKGPEIERVGYRRVKDPERLWEEVEAFYREEGLNRAVIVSCLPGTAVMVREIPSTFGNPRKLEQVIKYQTEPFLPHAIEEMVVDFLPHGPDGRVVTVAVLKEALKEHLGHLREIGLEPFATGVDHISLFLLYAQIHSEDGAGPAALVLLKRESVALGVVHEGKLVFVRVMLRGRDWLRELNRTMKLYAIKEPEHPIEKMLVSGYWEGEGDIVEEIREATGLETNIWRPFDNTRHRLGEMDGDLQARLAVPLGLALGAVNQKSEALDLRKEEYRVESAKDLKRAFVPMISGILLLVVLFTFNLYQNLHIKERRYEALKEEVSTLFEETFPDTRNIIKGQELAQMRQKIDEERGRYGWLDYMTRDVKVLDVLKVLTATISPFSEVDVDDLFVESGEVRLHGRASSFEIVDRLKTELSKKGFFSSVKLVSAEMDRKEKSVRFHFAMEKRP
jgi:Tfp pilus assembly PilM family ATPase/Tfp pilus assembly protein PilN